MTKKYITNSTVDISKRTAKATGTTFERSLADRFANVINVEDYGANNISDSAALVQEALDYAEIIGATTRVSTPILMNSPANGQNDQRVQFRNSGVINGTGGIFDVSLDVDKNNGLREFTANAAAKGNFNTIGQNWRLINNDDGGYGLRTGYHQTADITGFSIGQAVIAKSDGQGQMLSEWLVSSSPIGIAKDFGIFCAEYNPINVGEDSGYSKRRGLLTRWTGGLQIVPESKDLARTGSTATFNSLFGVVIAHSASNNNQGKRVKTYNAFLIEEEAVAAGGIGLQAFGSTGLTDRPLYAVRAEGNWKHAIDTSDGVFDNDSAFSIGNQQYIAWKNNAGTDTRKIFGVSANDEVIYGAAAADKSHKFLGLGPASTAFEVDTLTGSTSYVKVAPSVSDTPTIEAISSTAPNVDLLLKSKGTGRVRFGAYTAGALAIAGSVEIKDANGVVRKLAVVA